MSIPRRRSREFGPTVGAGRLCCLTRLLALVSQEVTKRRKLSPVAAMLPALRFWSGLYHSDLARFVSRHRKAIWRHAWCHRVHEVRLASGRVRIRTWVAVHMIREKKLGAKLRSFHLEGHRPTYSWALTLVVLEDTPLAWCKRVAFEQVSARKLIFRAVLELTVIDGVETTRTSARLTGRQGLAPGVAESREIGSFGWEQCWRVRPAARWVPWRRCRWAC